MTVSVNDRGKEMDEIPGEEEVKDPRAQSVDRIICLGTEITKSCRRNLKRKTAVSQKLKILKKLRGWGRK